MVCRDLGYRPILFSTQDLRGTPIYHTNVMMSVGTDVALVALESIADAGERRAVRTSLEASGRDIVALGGAQLDEFAGNTIELTGRAGRYLVISARAVKTLTAHQRRHLERYLELMPISVPTVELAGGSVRCMIATIHLPARGAMVGQGAPCPAGC